MLKRVGAFDQIPENDILKRIENLKTLISEKNIDCAIIVQNIDKFYFTGTMQKGTLVIPADSEPLLFIEKGFERAKMETPLAITPIRNDREMRHILNDRGVSLDMVGLELDVLPVSIFERMKKIIGFNNYIDIAQSIRELRSIKSSFEIEQMKKSGQITSHVFAKGKDIIKEGVTELDIESAMVAEGRKIGHQGYLRMRGINQEMMVSTVQTGYTGTISTSVDGPITGAGVTPALPQGSSFQKVEKGIPITVDYGGGYNGYITDETRVFVAGKLHERFQKPYDTAKEIIEDLISFAKQGIDSREIYLRAENIVRKAGLQEYFMGFKEGQVSFIGHGIGLEINELPVITARHKTILKEGMIFAFEPKFVVHPYGAIGIEVDFIVRPNGLERVTGSSIDIINV